MISDYDKVIQILKKYNIRDLEEIEYGKDCFDELSTTFRDKCFKTCDEKETEKKRREQKQPNNQTKSKKSHARLCEPPKHRPSRTREKGNSRLASK